MANKEERAEQKEVRPRDLARAALTLAGIGQDYWSCDFTNYQGPAQAAEKTKRYLTKLGQMKDEGVGLMWTGPFGPGKTTLAMITAKYLLRAGWNVQCTSLGDIVEAIQNSWSEADAGEPVLERYRRADFLFIDDVGKEHRGQSGFVQTVFDNLIRTRTQHRLPTFITTNHTKSELEDTYGGSVVSLLEGKIIPIVVNGRDIRRTDQRTKIRRALREDGT